MRWKDFNGGKGCKLRVYSIYTKTRTGAEEFGYMEINLPSVFKLLGVRTSTGNYVRDLQVLLLSRFDGVIKVYSTKTKTLVKSFNFGNVTLHFIFSFFII